MGARRGRACPLRDGVGYAGSRLVPAAAISEDERMGTYPLRRLTGEGDSSYPVCGGTCHGFFSPSSRPLAFSSVGPVCLLQEWEGGEGEGVRCAWEARNGGRGRRRAGDEET